MLFVSVFTLVRFLPLLELKYLPFSSQIDSPVSLVPFSETKSFKNALVLDYFSAAHDIREKGEIFASEPRETFL